MLQLNYKQVGFHKKLDKLLNDTGSIPNVYGIVKKIIENIETCGDKAIIDYTQKFDHVKLRAKDIRVTVESLSEAAKSISPADRKAIREAIRCVKDFHKKTLPKSWRGKNPHNAVVGENFYPIKRAGLYIPGGQVPLVSSVIMTAIPAILAGVPEIAVFTPPGADGSIDRSLLAALHLCGIDEVYKVGGAQAIAAMAIGTKSIRAVDKIAGPGNAYVIEAKRQLYGKVGIDLLPGPSEVMVASDKSANPKFIASELLSQAEHGTGKERIFFATTISAHIKTVQSEIEKQLVALSHADKIRSILKSCLIIIKIGNYDELVEVCNLIAPEHLQLMVSEQKQNDLVKKITTAGSILLGNYSPTVLGDFIAGPSHTLPTSGTGRFSGGLQTIDFMRRSSIVKYSPKQLPSVVSVVQAFSRMEKLDAHGNSLKIRLD